MVIRQAIRANYLSIMGSFLKPRNGVHILNSHYISPTSTDPEIFETQLKQLSKNVTFINIEEAVELIVKNKSIKKPLVAFTYDDGFKECYQSIAPVLENFHTNAAFFINPNFIDGDEAYKKKFLKRILTKDKEPLNWDEVTKLSEKGHIIGAHTMDHLNLGDTSLNTSELEYQIVNCKKIIEQKIKNKCSMFAFPFGQKQHLNSEALKISKENFEYIFSGTDYKNYFSFNGEVINRRHCEPFWPITHVNYFLSCEKNYNLRGE